MILGYPGLQQRTQGSIRRSWRLQGASKARRVSETAPKPPGRTKRNGLKTAEEDEGALLGLSDVVTKPNAGGQNKFAPLVTDSSWRRPRALAAVKREGKANSPFLGRRRPSSSTRRASTAAKGVATCAPAK